jgi:hypothetical protein
VRSRSNWAGNYEAKMITAKATTLQRRVNIKRELDFMANALFHTIAYRRHARCRLPWLLRPLCHAGGMVELDMASGRRSCPG